jgi:hypothetical protein
MAAGKLNLVVEQGATFARTCTILNNGTAVNLTGKTLRGKLRRKPTDASAAADFTIAVTNAAGGVFTLGLSATTTATMVAEPHFYDIELVDGATVTRLMEGTAYVSFEVTR